MRTTESQFIDRLTAPEIYPHPSTGVELVETHISWVLLTGLRAYKIKKPVNLGFVNFETLERRKYFCEEEVRLNSRLAPDLYLGVVPITGSLQDPQICGEGRIIEYAVQMRQFDKNHLLTVLPRKQLTFARIEQLADDCAEFHTRAREVSEDSQLGTPEATLQQVLDNLNVMQNCDTAIREQVSGLREQSEFWFNRLAPSFNERRLNGRVRECHGDLHLGNMFLQDDRITVFDGIEFNDSLRWIDVINDIAFLVMDLTVKDHRDLANCFLNRWLEQTGDYDGLRVLPFYCAYRAAVRAKVDVIRIGQPSVGFSEQRDLAHDCCDYLKLAHQYLMSHPLSLTITMGLSGSGKTTTTDRLIKTTNVIRIRSDVERKRLHGLRIIGRTPSEKESQVYSEQSSVAVYERLKHLAVAAIDAGFSVVVDATFLKREQRRSFALLAECLGVPFSIIHCQADESVLRKRIRERQVQGNDASEASESVLDLQLLNFEPLSHEEQMFTRPV